MAETLHFFFIKADDCDANRDLFVIAETARQAVDMLLRHFDIDEIQDLVESPTVLTLPCKAEGPSRVIPWEELFANQVSP